MGMKILLWTALLGLLLILGGCSQDELANNPNCAVCDQKTLIIVHGAVNTQTHIDQTLCDEELRFHQEHPDTIMADYAGEVQTLVSYTCP
jgi:hypothetical protein